MSDISQFHIDDNGVKHLVITYTGGWEKKLIFDTRYLRFVGTNSNLRNVPLRARHTIIYG
jgi:hypothetical protein